VRSVSSVVLTSLLLVIAPVGAQEDIQARMRSWSTALGVACAHCHVETAWSNKSKPAFDFARRMSSMVQALNVGPLKEFEPITCWTCHRGQTRPGRLPAAAWQSLRDRHIGEFTTAPNAALAMSVYAASLGVECSHCHQPANSSAPPKAGYAMVAKMLPVFDEIPRHFDSSRTPMTQCFMCHQGKRIPERFPR